MAKITPQTKIALGLPRGKAGYDWVWIESLLKMFSKHPAIYIPISKQAPHANARNDIARRFLESDADYILWIDSDTLWEPDDIAKLMEVIDAGADIATGIQFSCSEHHMPLVRFLDLELGVTRPLLELPRDMQPFEIGGCGFGLVLMKREVVESLKEPWFEFRSGFSEDLNFCLLAKLAGFKIFADPRILLGHLSSKVYTARDFLDIPKSMREVFIRNATMGTNKYLRDNYPNWRDDLGFNELQDKAKSISSRKQPVKENINTSEYWDRTYKNEIDSNCNWRTYPGKFPFIVKNLLKHLPEKSNVLEIGAGLGILAEQIKEEYPSFTLDTMDISPYAVEFMSKKGLNSSIGVLPNWLKNNLKTYSCVIGCEILEHLDEEPRKETVKAVYESLEEGGLAIFTLPDDCMPPSEIPEHTVCYNKQSFEKFLNDSFTGDIQVYSRKVLVSDIEHPEGLQWGEANFLFGLCVKA